MSSPTSLEFHPSVFGSVPVDPGAKPARLLKRIIVCCDGTWQDGLAIKERWRYTNILRLSRCIRTEDTRHDPPIPQVVFYQSGVGSEHNLCSYLQGYTGASLGDKVQEAYAFIAQNYHPGDEIFLFGFSRGAYTARMVAMFISAIGVLNRADMDHFATIFVNFQKRGKSENKAEIEELEKMLAPWTSPDSHGKMRTSSADSFSVKCVGVFDTVGALGLPEELSLHPKSVQTIFGFSDRVLSPDIANAFQALAIHESRADFKCCKFEQTEEGRNKKQVLKQCWFPGSHADIGGGWQDHDLSDLTLTWMAAHIGDMLSLDLKYLASLPRPVAPWGSQQPHDPNTGIFVFAHEMSRQLPTSSDTITQETIHPSVIVQPDIVPAHVVEHPGIVHDLMPLEQQLKDKWPYKPNDTAAVAYAARVQAAKAHGMKATSEEKNPSLLAKFEKIGKEVGHKVLEKASHTEIMRNQRGQPVQEKNWLAKLVDETHVGPYMTALKEHQEH